MAKILIADDNQAMRYYLEKTLASAGHDVCAVKDGKELVDQFDRDTPDLVITDVQMPVLDGFEAVRELRSRAGTGHIPIIFVSATFLELRSKTKGLDLGANDYLPAPIEEEELLAKVGAMLRVKAVYEKLSAAKATIEQSVHELETHRMELEMQNEELRRTQEELTDSRNQYSDLYDFAPIGYLSVSDKGLILQANLTAVDMLGVERTGLIKQRLSAFVHDDDQASYYLQLRQVLHTKERQTCELRLRKADGVSSWVEMILSTAAPADDTTGVQVRSVITDITDRKQAEFALKQSEEKYRLLINNADVLVSVYDRDGRCLLMNNRVAQNLGGTPADFVGKSFQELHPEMAEEFTAVFRELVETDTSQDSENLVQFPTGARWLLSNVQPIKDADGHVIAVQIISHDITERKHAEQKLLESETRHKRAQEVAHIGHWELDSYDSAPRWSDEIFTIFGVDPGKGEPSFTQHDTIIHPEEWPLLEEAIQAGFRDGASFDLVFRILRPGDAIGWVHAIGMATRDAEGQAFRMFGTAQDITRLKRLEEELHRIEWLLTKSLPGDSQHTEFRPAYGDVTELNTSRIILDAVGAETLRDIATDLMSLLGTSVAVYERNGDYAFGMFESGWCQLLDQASRDLCNTDDNARALACGKWLCHEDCWNNSATPAMKTGEPTDIACVGNIRLYAVPILAGSEVVGVINVGYDAPPTEAGKLEELAEKYAVDTSVLRREASAYEQRPKYIVEMAKERVASSARLIGEIVERRRAEKKATETHQQLLRQQEREKTQVEAELEKVRDELVRKTRLAAIGQVSGSIAHELRNPLGSVRNAAYYLKRHAPKDQPKMTQFLEIIETQVTRADKIISSLMEMTRSKELAAASIDLRKMVEEVLEHLGDIDGLRCTMTMDPDPYLFHADPELFRQVVTNLITNAAEAMNGDGALVVEASRNDRADIIIFRDSGPGVVPDIRDRLFEPLVTSKTTGTGLGLSICRQVIERHGGTIEVVDEDKPGAAFQISLPRGRSKKES
ncbi:MAG: PAS domain S-box protein [Planctomycetes bacterium]|nr:PAS domain S-box protein [Planctomycetota bacterium]